MKYRPIIFSTNMVEAILDGHKSETRRIVKKHIPEKSWVKSRSGDDYNWIKSDTPGSFVVNGSVWAVREFTDLNTPILICPYGAPGDRLWVKETWLKRKGGRKDFYIYKAGYEKKDLKSIKWKSSLFMPREASRITLEITDVKVETLGEITPEACFREGACPDGGFCNAEDCEKCVVSNFKTIWQSVSKEPEPWNPEAWVWVLSFRAIQPEIKPCQFAYLKYRVSKYPEYKEKNP